MAATIPQTVPPADIPSYRVTAPGLATGGQPSAAAIDGLKAQGFKTVVNLRNVAEDPIVGQEGAKVAAQGLRYVSVPITPASFSEADVAAVRTVLEDPKAAPVLLHCHSANRVGAVWAAILVSRGRSLAEAEAEGRTVGLKDGPMMEAFRRVVGKSGTTPAR